MQDYIIIAIIVVIAGFCLRSAIAHFKGQGGCCGGSSNYKPKRKKLSHGKYQKTFQLEGIHCQHCKNRVEEVVNDISGVAGKVNLKQGLLAVSYAEDVANEIHQSSAGTGRLSREIILFGALFNPFGADKAPDFLLFYRREQQGGASHGFNHIRWPHHRSDPGLGAIQGKEIFEKETAADRFG